jgi:hypothetical protein
VGHALCLQNWVTIGGNSTTIVQDEPEWADLAGYQDVAIYLDVGLLNAATTLDVQTSPIKDETMFTGGPTVTSYRLVAGSGPQPIAVAGVGRGAALSFSRFVRWSISFGATDTALTFRIWLNLHQTGW